MGWKDIFRKKTPRERAIDAAKRDADLQRDIAQAMDFVHGVERRIRKFFDKLTDQTHDLGTEEALSDAIKRHGFWMAEMPLLHIALGDKEQQAVMSYWFSRRDRIRYESTELRELLTHLLPRPRDAPALSALEEGAALAALLQNQYDQFRDTVFTGLTELQNIIVTMYPKLIDPDVVRALFPAFISALRKDFARLERVIQEIERLERL